MKQPQTPQPSPRSASRKISLAIDSAPPLLRFIEYLEPRTLLAFAPIGPAFQVGSAYGAQTELAFDADGNFVVVWTGQDTASSNGIRARRFDAAGNPLGADFVVNTTTLGSQRMPSIAMNAHGDFVIAWESNGASNWGINAQRFQASGVPAGPEFRVNSSTELDQYGASVAIDPDGDFVVAWGRAGQVSYQNYISRAYARRYDANGVALGSEFKITGSTVGNQYNPSVAMTGDQTIFAWFNDAADTDHYSINARRYDAGGNPVGDDFQVNSTKAHANVGPSVAMLGDASFIVGWWGYGSKNEADVHARQFDAVGQALSAEFAVASPGYQVAAVADERAILDWAQTQSQTLLIDAHTMPASGRFVHTWSDDNGIYAQRFGRFSNPASVEGFLWQDLNANGIQDPDESGSDGNTVDLFNEFGVLIDRTITADGGLYRFDELRPGDAYYLQFFAPPDYLFTLDNQGASDSLNSDVGAYTGRTAHFTPLTSESKLDFDAGVIPSARISGIVFGDRNQNGIRDDELGLAGRTIFLDDNANGLRDQQEQWTITDGVGFYTFEWLRPGTYTVAAEVDASSFRTSPASGAHTVILSSGESAGGKDFGAYVPGLPSLGSPLRFAEGGFLPVVAADALGNFVVVWSRLEPGEQSATDVYAQRYDAGAQSLGPEFRVNSTTAGMQGGPAVAMNAAGQFIIAWSGNGPQDDSGVFAQRYDADAQPFGGEFRMNTSTAGQQYLSSVAINSQGQFAASWNRVTASPAGEVYAQRYTATGAPDGAEMLVSDVSAGVSSVAIDPDGDLIVAWESRYSGCGYFGCWSSSTLRARRYDTTGQAQPELLAVAGYNHDLVMDADGDFMITWSDPGYISFGIPYLGHGVYARRYDANGLPKGPSEIIDSDPYARCSVAMDSEGDYFVACNYAYISGTHITRYSAAGVPQGRNFTLPLFGNMAMAASDDFVLVWGDSGSIVAQRFDIHPSITSATLLDESSPHRLRLRFSGHIQASLSVSDLILERLGPGGGPVAISNLTYDPARDTATFRFADHQILPDGNYRLSVAAGAIEDSSHHHLAANFSFDFFVFNGDLNHDRSVSIADFITLASNLNKSNATYADGDVDYDGKVSIADFLILSAKFNTALPPPLTMPQDPAAAKSVFILDSDDDQLLAGRKKPAAARRAKSIRRPHLHHDRRHSNRPPLRLRNVN